MLEGLGDRLRELRRKRGLTLRDAAKQLGISPGRLTAIERGRSYATDQATRPSRELIERMAAVYEVARLTLLADAGYDFGESADLSDGARQVVAMYESLTPAGQETILDIMRVFIDRGR